MTPFKRKYKGYGGGKMEQFTCTCKRCGSNKTYLEQEFHQLKIKCSDCPNEEIIWNL